ncbi:MAG TPA: type II toxin-antitoxin system HicA family toxin [Coriobacteriia bacterium]|nr:type II toxin-antitoxin system HicA family toxin [Coriobacteriia bacterium]
MPRLTPVSRRQFIARMRELGFSEPVGGPDHDFMTRGTLKVKVPNPHRGDVSADLLARILRNAGISRDEWLG